MWARKEAGYVEGMYKWMKEGVGDEWMNGGRRGVWDEWMNDGRKAG